MLLRSSFSSKSGITDANVPLISAISSVLPFKVTFAFVSLSFILLPLSLNAFLPPVAGTGSGLVMLTSVRVAVSSASTDSAFILKPLKTRVNANKNANIFLYIFITSPLHYMMWVSEVFDTHPPSYHG